MSKTKKDANGKPLPLVPFFQRGNYLPVREETQYKAVKIVQGKIPTDINGTFIKNGPNPLIDDAETLRSHWFSGDGMLHAFCIDDGQLYYCNRYIQTDKYKLEKKTGRRETANLQDFTEIGVMLAPLEQLEKFIGY